jgi:putative acetyltransferase
MVIRDERPGDEQAIHGLLLAAFAGHPHSLQTEHLIVDALRHAGALALSEVAEEEGTITGYLAASPVEIDGAFHGWCGLGPVAVLPERQGKGTGTRLILEGLDRMRAAAAAGCVVLGEPSYYQRFGFSPRAGLVLPGVPSDYFMALPFGRVVPAGTVAYHPAFAATG